MQKENDLIFVQVVDRNIVIHTMDETYIGSINDQVELLLSYFGFERSDENKYVLVEKILTRSKKEKRVYFDKDKKKFCPVTRPYMKKFFW